MGERLGKISGCSRGRGGRMGVGDVLWAAKELGGFRFGFGIGHAPGGYFDVCVLSRSGVAERNGGACCGSCMLDGFGRRHIVEWVGWVARWLRRGVEVSEIYRVRYK